jgi:hypothetical protein
MGSILFGTSTAKEKASKHTPHKRAERTDDGAHDIVPSVVITGTQWYWKQNEERKTWKLYNTGNRDDYRVVWVLDVEQEQHAIEGDQDWKNDDG